MAKKVMTLRKGIHLASGTLVPKGTKLRVGNESRAYYKGESVDTDLIPDEALENDDEGILNMELEEALEQIDELIDKACEGDEEALEKIVEIAGETGDALTALIEEGSTDKKAMEDGFGDLEEEELKTLKDVVGEVLEKLEDAKESGDAVEIEDAVEQFRSIMRK